MPKLFQTNDGKLIYENRVPYSLRIFMIGSGLGLLIFISISEFILSFVIMGYLAVILVIFGIYYLSPRTDIVFDRNKKSITCTYYCRYKTHVDIYHFKDVYTISAYPIDFNPCAVYNVCIGVSSIHQAAINLGPIPDSKTAEAWAEKIKHFIEL